MSAKRFVFLRMGGAGVLLRYDSKQHFYVRYPLRELMRHEFPTFADCRNGNLFVCGGVERSGSSQAVAAAWVFDTQQNRMFALDDMIVARYRHAAALCGREMYIAGGFGVDKAVLRSVEKYNFDAKEW